MKKTHEITVSLLEHTGSFAENKDVARTIREQYLSPALKKGENVILDFSGVDSMTQSFTHALISDLIRTFGKDVFDKLAFKNCNPTVERIINIVAEYMQGNYNEDEKPG